MRFLIITLFLLIGVIASAQPPKKFYSTYGGNGYDVGYDVKQTLDGGYIIIGSTSSYGQGNTDMYLLKIDSMGQKVFQNTFGGVSNEIGKSIVQLADSSYVMVGYTSSSGIGGYDVFLVKADKSGNLIWQKTIGGNDWDFANSMNATADGGFIIAGTTYSYGHGNADGYVIKTNANGDTLWTKTFGGLKDDEFKSVIQTADGNYALAGYTKSYNDSLGDGWVYKLNSVGDSTYSSSIGGAYFDFLNNVIELQNNDLYFAGSNKSFKNGSNSVNWVYLTDSNNSIILNTYVGNLTNEQYNASSKGINGVVMTVGINHNSVNTSAANIHLFNPNITFISYTPFALEKLNVFYSVSKTMDKGFVCVGSCNGNTSLLEDILIVKTDSLANYGVSIIGINENEKPTVDIRLFPNPTSSVINIRINNFQEYKKLSYKIVDLSGNILLSNNINDFKHTVTISDFSDGLYLLQIFDSNKLLSSSKISVIK